VDRLPSKLPINWQGAPRRGEVLPWSERRRRWSWKEKAEIVAESLAPNAVETAIARRYGLHRNQLYAWRKELRETANDGSRETANDGSPNSGSAPLEFVPVVVPEECDVPRTSGDRD
jgi:transposase